MKPNGAPTKRFSARSVALLFFGGLTIAATYLIFETDLLQVEPVSRFREDAGIHPIQYALIWFVLVFLAFVCLLFVGLWKVVTRR